MKLDKYLIFIFLTKKLNNINNITNKQLKIKHKFEQDYNIYNFTIIKKSNEDFFNKYRIGKFLG